MDWKHWLGVIGGTALGFIPGGGAVKEGIRAIGGSVAGASLQAAGQKQVTDKLTEAGNKSLDLQRQQTAVAQQKLDQAQQIQQQLYGRSLANLSPYTSLGAGAAGLLGQGLGIAPSSSAGPPPPLSPGISVPPLGQMGLSPVKPGNDQGIVLNPMGPTLHPAGGPPGLPNTLANAGAAMSRGSSYSGAGTVLMAAPDGSQMPVPKDQVQTWISKGARVVS